MSGTAVRSGIFSPHEIRTVTGGNLLNMGQSEIDSVVIDSRKVKKGSLFIPLVGTRTDGHQFLEDALARGASAVLAAGLEWGKRKAAVLPLAKSRRASVIIIASPLEALQSLAAYHMKRLPGVLRIGITGSNGKTTTKELLGSILARTAGTAVNEGNLNSEIGLPLSAFRVTEKHRFAVFEMGINRPGEMDILTDIVRPDLAVITNIGRAHIGLLGSKAVIAREKRKIFKHFNGSQKAFIYEEERFFDYLSVGLAGKVISYGTENTAGYEGSRSLGLDGIDIHWEELRIRFPLFGFSNLLNALATISVSAELGISKSKIKKGLEEIKPLFGRSQIIKGRVSIIQDCYNANPDSVLGVIEFIRSLRWKGRKVAVLGSMLELGRESEEAHRKIGIAAGKSGFELIFLYGREMEPAYKALKLTRYAGLFDWLTDLELLTSRLVDELKPGDLVLLKGSRALELERLLPTLEEQAWS